MVPKIGAIHRPTSIFPIFNCVLFSFAFASFHESLIILWIARWRNSAQVNRLR